MIERGMMRTYLHYVVPASIAFTLACVYSIIDGLFVGNHVGDAGLAGINIAAPLRCGHRHRHRHRHGRCGHFRHPLRCRQ